MKQHRVQDINPSSNHDNLDILGDLKAIQLVEQFQHCAPHFAAPFSDFFQLWGANKVNFSHEDVT